VPTYLARRLLTSAIVLLLLSVGVFAMVRLVPGDTATALLGTAYTPEAADRLRAELGLDRPLPMQYVAWLGQVARGDLGKTAGGVAVATRIGEALPVTLELVLIAMAVAVALGIPLGVLAATRRGGWADAAVGLLGLVGLSVPGFWLGTLLILVFALWLRWLPSGGYVALTVDPIGNLLRMAMPGVALGLAVSAVVMRMTRDAVLDVLPSAYVRVATAKGLARRSVLFRHALRNAMIPVLTILGIQAGYLLGGSVVIEEVFGLNGLGRLILRAIGDRDYALLQGAVMLVGTAFIAINLAVDVLYAAVDPRVRVGGDR
jgi:peptide/nickel transport system permease protein